MEDLTLLEATILREILENNKEKYSFLLSHIPLIKIKSREFTGVGMYVNFEYTGSIDIPKINALLSSDKYLFIDDLKYVTYVLDITDGEIKYLEIVTIGDDAWNGTYKSFKLSSAE
jgi:hypothetical protein